MTAPLTLACGTAFTLYPSLSYLGKQKSHATKKISYLILEGLFQTSPTINTSGIKSNTFGLFPNRKHNKDWLLSRNVLFPLVECWRLIQLGLQPARFLFFWQVSIDVNCSKLFVLFCYSCKYIFKITFSTETFFTLKSAYNIQNIIKAYLVRLL